VTIGGRLEGAEFARFAGQRVLVVCDIEGAELDLMQPELYPALRAFDCIVELHQTLDPLVADKIRTRFQASHEVSIVPNSITRTVKLPPIMQQMSHLDQLAALCEFRGAPTPWAVMTALR
jgi:hypothetical protein